MLATLVVAWRQPGFAEVPPAPDDRSVWVVNDERLLVGRINTGIAELDSAAVLRGAQQAAGYWLRVDERTAVLLGGFGRCRRWRARLSLASMRRKPQATRE